MTKAAQHTLERMIADACAKYSLKIFDNISPSAIEAMPAERSAIIIGRALIDRTDYAGFLMGLDLIRRAQKKDRSKTSSPQEDSYWRVDLETAGGAIDTLIIFSTRRKAGDWSKIVDISKKHGLAPLSIAASKKIGCMSPGVILENLMRRYISAMADAKRTVDTGTQKRIDDPLDASLIETIDIALQDLENASQEAISDTCSN